MAVPRSAFALHPAERFDSVARRRETEMMRANGVTSAAVLGALLGATPLAHASADRGEPRIMVKFEPDLPAAEIVEIERTHELRDARRLPTSGLVVYRVANPERIAEVLKALTRTRGVAAAELDGEVRVPEEP